MHWNRASWKPFVLAACLLSLGGTDQEPGAGAPLGVEMRALEHFGAEHDQGLFFAVLEGLYEDGVSNAVVDRMLEIDPVTRMTAIFVYACPVCMPVLRAAHVYRDRQPFYASKTGQDTFGPGLDAAEEREILQPDRARARAAIEGLVERWLRRRLDRLRLTEPERAAWQRALEEGREQGMRTLETYRPLGGSYGEMKTCPACEGGNGACRPSGPR